MKRLSLLVVVAAFSVRTITAASFPVTTTADSGAGSLRLAITGANGAAGADTITFNIPSSDPNCDATTHVCTITPATALPAITGLITIDGYTQPGTTQNTLAVGNNAVLRVRLSGSSLSSGAGLLITAGSSTIRGLVINGFVGVGITLQTGDSNVVTGNFIGTNPSGTAAVPNGIGIDILGSADNLIGGTTPAARNLLSGNTDGQVVIESDASGNQVQGCYVGPNAAGNLSLSMSGDRGTGITVRGPDNIIGGTAGGAGNLISGNANEGIFLNIAQGTGIQGNLIGTNANGTASNSNGIGNVDGVGAVSIGGGTGNVVGGTTAASRNVISGNTGPGTEEGVLVDGSGNTVQGNFIGVDISGSAALGNMGPGILAQGGSDNSLGGIAPGAGNIIAFNNLGVEIRAAGTAVLHDAVLSNSIFSNSPGLGIDLHNGFPDDGVTANDPCDSDVGANNFQNFPIITSATSAGGSTTIKGSLNSTASTTFRVEFFSSSNCDSSGNGPGQTFLGSADVTTDGSCNASFSVVLSTTIAPGAVITATATDPAGNTSEFSACSAAAVTSPTVLANISTRLRVETEDNVLIGGFIVTGTQPKPVLIRGIGPSLPVVGKLADPMLELHDGAGVLITSNDNWQDAPNKQEIIDSTIPPTNALESAILRSLAPGAYTAVVSGTNATTGVGLVEAYDLDRTVDSQLANISTRGLVQTGDNVMIGGFIAVGTDPLTVIARAIGPSLPVAGKLADPTLELHDGNGNMLAFNNNWKDTQEAEIIATTVPPTNDLESAIVMTLPPGPYTAIVSGVNGTTGVALVEVYALN